MANTKSKVVPKNKFADIPENVDPNQIIMVRNGFNGRLIYVSTKTGEKYVWDALGDEAEMDIKELRSAKGSQKRFFEDNWFMFDDEYSWVIPYLGVTKYYENALSVDDLQDFTSKTPSEIKKICTSLGEGQRKTVTYLVRQLFEEGKIDSMKTVSALEEGLGISLIER